MSEEATNTIAEDLAENDMELLKHLGLSKAKKGTPEYEKEKDIMKELNKARLKYSKE